MKRKWKDRAWDAWCLLSIAGIWPRFVEPNLLHIKKIKVPISNLPKQLSSLKILHLSDLHLHKGVSDRLLNKIIRTAGKECPDLICLTGDFLCRSKLMDKERLSNFLNQLKAPLGCFACLGNHDYSPSISINKQGDYAAVDEPDSQIAKGFQRLLMSIHVSGTITESAKSATPCPELIDLLKTAHCTLLDNSSCKVDVNGVPLTIVGLGEYSAGKLQPGLGFSGVDPHGCSIVLAHNPDSIKILQDYPGQLILSGHTHGGQINLPWIWKRFTLQENMTLKKGLHRIRDKWLYINKGLASLLQFRFFAMPEATFITLESA